MPAGKSPTDFTYLASCGFTLFVVNYYGQHQASEWQNYLNAAHEAGLKLWVTLGEEIFSDNWDDLLRPIAGHQALGAAIAWDEPAWLIDRRGGGSYESPYYGIYTRPRYLHAVDAIKQKYANVPLVVIQSGYFRDHEYNTWVAEYSSTMDLTGFDDYRWPDTGDQYVWQKAAAEWMKSVSDGKPVYAVLQGFGRVQPDFSVIDPPRDVLLAEARGALAGGAAGLIWWTLTNGYGEPVHHESRLWQDIVSVSREVRGL